MGVLHRKMEPILLSLATGAEREKIDSSAEALRVGQARSPFPSSTELCNNATRAIARTKLQRMAIDQTLKHQPL